MVKTENFEKVEVASQQELRDWLLKNQMQEESIWLVTFKKVEKVKYVSTSQVLDELISFGWIDGIRRKLDDKKTMQLISPRKVQHWSKTYKDRARRLIEEGKMMPSGLASIALSKKTGLWNFLDDVDALIKPPDLIKALEENHPALFCFNNFGSSVQRFTLRWIKMSKTPETRAERIVKTALLASRNEKIPMT